MFEKLATQFRNSDVNYPLLVPLLVSSFLIQMVTALVRVTISYRAVELGMSIVGLGFIACAFAIFPILIAVQIGRALGALHSLPRALVMDADLPAYSAEQCRKRMLHDLDRAATTGQIPGQLLRRWEEAMEDTTLWQFSTRVVHGDLHEDNITVDHGSLASFTGWSDLHVGDPA